MTDSRVAFLSAADSFVAQVARIPVRDLAGPGLGDWDLRALVGHTSRSLVTVRPTSTSPPTRWRSTARPTTTPSSPREERPPATRSPSGDVGPVRRWATIPRGSSGRWPTGAGEARAARCVVPPDHDRRRHAPRRVPPHPHLRARRARVRRRGGVRHRARASTPLRSWTPPPSRPRWPSPPGSGPDLLMALTGRRPLPHGFTVV